MSLAAVGLMHIAHGNPHGSIDRLEHAGGVLGALSGAPLRAALGPAGAAIVLVAIGVFGLLLVDRHRVAPDRRAASRLRPASSASSWAR